MRLPWLTNPHAMNLNADNEGCRGIFRAGDHDISCGS